MFYEENLPQVFDFLMMQFRSQSWSDKEVNGLEIDFVFLQDKLSVIGLTPDQFLRLDLKLVPPFFSLAT